MCSNCDINYWLSDTKPYSIEPLCTDYMFPAGVTISVAYSAYTDITTVELRSEKNPMHNMAYAFTNEFLASQNVEQVLAALHNGFKPFYEVYPSAMEFVEKYVRAEYQPKSITVYKPKTNMYSSLPWDQYENLHYQLSQTPPPKDKFYQQLMQSYEMEKSASYGGRPHELDTFPGLTEMVKYPGKHATPDSLTMTLERAIIKLNDKDKWTREQIADWLETLDVDITFRSTDAD